MRLRKSSDALIVSEEENVTLYDSNKHQGKTKSLLRPALSFLSLLAISASYGLLLRPASKNTRATLEKPRDGNVRKRLEASIEELRPASADTTLPHDNVRKRFDGSSIEEEKQCQIFLAPSSLKGHTGFGIYTTRDISKHESILAGPDGPSIPVVDYEDGPTSMKKVRKKWIHVWDNYWWD